MTVAGENTVLTEIKAVGPGYPLEGRIDHSNASDASQPRRPTGIPDARNGVGWTSDCWRGCSLEWGNGFRWDSGAFASRRHLIEEPESSVGFLNLGPRLILNAGRSGIDGLVQVGSRVSYRLAVSGDADRVQAFRSIAAARIGPGQRVEDVRDARPEIRSALERAEKFLGLSALLSVILAAVAVALAARRYLRRHLDGCAVMRCLGASQGLILRLHVQQFVILGTGSKRVGLRRRGSGAGGIAVLLTPWWV